MKIGILGSGNDMLGLFVFLHRYDAEFVVWIDDAHFSWGDKPFSLVEQRVKVGLSFLRDQGVDVVIVPPIIELMMQGAIGFNVQEMGGVSPLPLFASYVNQVLSMSLVGKIGFVGDWLDVKMGQAVLKDLFSSFDFTPTQRATKKFQIPLAWWGKEVRNWKYFLDTMSWSHPLMNRIVKQDLRYFKDADVDTLLSLNYGYFFLEKVIHKACNTSRLLFHGVDVLESVFARFVSTSSYSVKVFCTGHGEFLTRSKKLMWLLGRGKTDLVEVKKEVEFSL